MTCNIKPRLLPFLLFLTPCGLEETYLDRNPAAYFVKVCPGQGANPGSFWFLFIFSLINCAVDHSATAPRLHGKRVHYPSRHSLLGLNCVIYLEVPVARTNFNTDKKKLGTHTCKWDHEVVPNQRVFLEGPGPQIFVARTAATAATVRIVT